ncbi:MAG: PEP-CTERM sorting domain-containing protein [Pseudomonadota bacterium]
MKIRKRHSDLSVKAFCRKPGEMMTSQARQLAKATLLCAAIATPSLASAQETIVMLEHTAATVSGSQAAPIAVSAVRDLNTDVSAASGNTLDGKSPITGLEPGTLALIGFGLLALAATRRNAK